MPNANLPFMRHARANLAEVIARLDGVLFPKDPLPTDTAPFILVDQGAVDRYLFALADGRLVVSGGPATLDTAQRYPSLAAASDAAKRLRTERGSRLAPALARSWQLLQLDVLNKALASLDDQIAQADAEEASIG